MRIGACLDQLSVDSKPVADSLDVPFQKMGNSQLLADLTRVSRISTFVKVPGRAADDLQVCDSREIGDYFILHANCEKGVLLIIAEIIKRQHCDAFFGDACRGRYNCPGRERQARRPLTGRQSLMPGKKQNWDANDTNRYSQPQPASFTRQP